MHMVARSLRKNNDDALYTYMIPPYKIKWDCMSEENIIALWWLKDKMDAFVIIKNILIVVAIK
jgi:hypothetical protein